MLDARAVPRLQPATGGFATSVWRIDGYALRVFRAGDTATLRREVSAMQAAQRAGVAVPRVHAIGTHEARPALLVEWCAGQPVLRVLETQPWRILQLGYAFGRLHRRLHAARAALDLRDAWIDWPRPAEPALAARLRALPLVTDRLLHLDFHPLNVLAEAGQITAVLDWTNAHAGDPRADFARTATILRLAPGPVERVQRVGRRIVELAWRAGYGPPGRDMPVFYAWAGQAMLHDLAGRVPAAALEPARRWSTTWLRRALPLR